MKLACHLEWILRQGWDEITVAFTGSQQNFLLIKFRHPFFADMSSSFQYILQSWHLPIDEQPTARHYESRMHVSGDICYLESCGRQNEATQGDWRNPLMTLASKVLESSLCSHLNKETFTKNTHHAKFWISTTQWFPMDRIICLWEIVKLEWLRFRPQICVHSVL